ncbi:hypothetical protein BJ742DRAFT_340265 [Cladochytrium replicatum]|nr:hypothetical protein BJ742DRAFT_340265 [Cladochytrium replicatum]
MAQDPPKASLWQRSTAVLSNLSTYVFSRNDATRSAAAADLPPTVRHLTRFFLIAASTGFVVGFAMGSRQRGMQFLAENAHRLPRTKAGWFYYHRHKNYESIRKGGKEAMKYAGVFGTVLTAFAGLECAVDEVAGRESFLNATVAGVGLAGVFAASRRFSVQYTKYAVRYAVTSSTAMGLLEDGYAIYSGVSIKDSDQKRPQVLREMFYLPLDPTATFSTKDSSNPSGLNHS